MVVWQDPEFAGAHATPQSQGGRRGKPNKDNTNTHRRVDIIVTPWRNVGCAVLGWTADMTFERDLRRYAKDVCGWKFDSSGIRDLRTGGVVECAVDGGEGGGDGTGAAAVSGGTRGSDAEGPLSAEESTDSDPGSKHPTEDQQIERAEREVFRVLGLEWIHPWDRCTG